MSTYTKEQLKAMQDAGVPIEIFYEYCGSWCDESPYVFSDPPCNYRPRPGFTFSGTIPRKLMDAGIRIERHESQHGWVPVAAVTNCTARNYRIADSSEPIANPAGRPICLRDLVADLEAERDALKAQVKDLKAKLEAVKEEAWY